MKAVRLYAKGDLRVEDITAPGAPAEKPADPKAAAKILRDLANQNGIA